MFTRRVVFRLKTDSSAEFRRMVEGDNSNFTKHLWRTHTRHAPAQSPDSSGESTAGHRQSRDGKTPDR